MRGLHGLRGAVRVEVLTDRPDERFAPGARLHREGLPAALTIVEAEPDGRGLRVRFAEVPDRTAAESLRGVYLEATVPPRQQSGEGAWYWHELIGLQVRAPDGSALGSVRDVYRTGGTEVLVVSGGPRGEFDLPMVRALIERFDPAAGELVVDPAAIGLVPDPIGGAEPGREAPEGSEEDSSPR